MLISKRSYIIALFFLVYYLLSFYPIITSGFYSDDIFFVQGTKGNTLYDNISLLELVKQDTELWIKSARFAPLFYLVLRSLFYFFNDAFSYKIALIVLNMAAAFSFAAFLYLLQKNKKIVLLTLILLPAFFQYRVMYHDAYSTFSGLYQGIAILNFAALSFFILYLKSSKKYFLAASLLFLIAGFCYSEMTLVFIPMYLFVVLWVNENVKLTLLNTVKKIVPIATVTALYFLLVIFMRLNKPKDHYQYEGLKASFKISAMARVLHAQIFSVIPMSYINYEINFMRTDPKDILPQMKEHASIIALALLLVLYLTFLIKYNSIQNESTQYDNKLFLWIGLLLLLLPAVLIMPSEKYQNFSRPGNGYIPVYLQNMGGAMLFAMLIHNLLNAASSIKRYIGKGLVVLFLFIILITSANNMRLVAHQNYRVYYPSLALEKALNDGLMDSVDENDTIWLTNNFHWGATEYYMYLFFEKTKKRLVVVNSINENDFNNSSKNIYQLSFPESYPNIVSLKKVTSLNNGDVTFDNAAEKNFSYTFFN
jgi:hypothetical protein